MSTIRRKIASFLAALLLASPAMAQEPSAAPPVVGVMNAELKAITESAEFNGRIQAPDRVDLVPRVTAFLNERLFEEGADVKKGDLLYRLERAPFEAEVRAREAAVAQAEAQLENANVTLKRAQELLRRETGTQVAVDDALASQRSAAAQVKSAEAQLKQSQINLDYTEIRAPVSGRIGRTAVTAGNVVTPTSGVLTTIVSQDPMYVLFPVSVRRALELRDRYAAHGGFEAVRIRLRLPDGKMYDQTGKLDFVDIRVETETDSITFRGTIPNPAQQHGLRELAHDMFVRVSLEAVEPTKVLAIPRAAVLSDQQGSYVYVVNDQDVAEQRRVTLGQSTPATAAIAAGLKEGDRVIVEGIQRARPNLRVAPAPASPQPGQG